MPLRYNEQTGMFEEVIINPQINYFTFDGAPIKYNDEVVKFTWDVQDAFKIFINEIEVSVTSTSYDYPLTGSGLQNFILKIEAGGIEKTESVRIKVLELPVFKVEQSSNKLRKGKGDSCVIKWNIQNAKSLKLRDNDEQLPLIATRSFTPDSTKNYIFEIVGLDGNRIFTHIVHVDVLEEASVQFEVDKVLTLPYVPIKLTWNVLNATKIELDGYGEVGYRGDKIIECDRETLFTLIVTDAFGITKYYQRVKLYPLPLIRSILVPTPIIERNITVETHFEFKHLQVGINVNTLNVPKYEELNLDVFIPEVKVCQLLVPLNNFPQYKSILRKKLNNARIWLKTNIIDKISKLWNT